MSDLFDNKPYDRVVTTIYGYDIDDLIVVATMMRSQGLTPDDIAQLVRDWRMNLQMIGELFKNELAKSLEKEMGLNRYV